jgi:hypothetical protein
LQDREDRQRVAKPPWESSDGGDPQRCDAGCKRRGEVAKLLDAGDRADGGAFARVEQPRPQLNREVTFPTRGSSDHVKHHLGHHVEDQQRAGLPFGDSGDQLVDLVALEVREQTLRGDGDRDRRIQLIKPIQIERRPTMA